MLQLRNNVLSNFPGAGGLTLVLNQSCYNMRVHICNTTAKETLIWFYSGVHCVSCLQCRILFLKSWDSMTETTQYRPV